MPLPYAPALEVDLPAITRNYQLLSRTFTGPSCAAVVKANGYGLGAAAVTRALHRAGCSTFFVATLEEALSLRRELRDLSFDLFVFHGVGPGEEAEFRTQNLRPVLNDPVQLERWAGSGGGASALHVDTGMCRLGLSGGELDRAIASGIIQRAGVALLMSHLACAGTPDDPKNAEQLARIKQAQTKLPSLPISFANSSGVFLDPSFHFDLGRPGCALYGITPRDAAHNPMENVVRLTAPILQLRTLERDETVGYGATYTARKGAVLATLAMGYADGYFRLLTGKAKGHVNGVEVPIVGRVSMDMIIADVTAIPGITLENRVELIGPRQDVNAIADAAGTIGYEVFTRLGNRVHRIYQNIGQKP